MRAVIAARGYAPTLGELARLLGVESPSTAAGHLDALERMGYIERGAGARAIRVLV